MTILHVITQSRVSGAELNMVRLCRGLQESGHEVEVVCRPASALIPVLDAAHIASTAGPICGKLNLGAASWIADYARSRGAEIIHTHNSTASYHGTRAGRLAGIPTVAHVQGLHWRSTLRGCYRRATRLIGCSEAVRRSVIAAGYPADRITTVYNAVDAAGFAAVRNAEQVRDELGIGRGELAAVTVAHFSRKKGHLDLLAALTRILAEHPQTRFVWVGEGKLRTMLERRLSRLGIRERVIFTGYRTDVADIVHAADLFVLPSWCEPMGIVYCEAMLAAKPVVACDAGGAPEVVADKETGLLVPPRTPAALASAISRLLADGDLRRHLGAAGRNRVLQQFSYERMVEAVEDVYRACLNPAA